MISKTIQFSLKILFFISIFPLAAALQGVECKTELKVGDEFNCNVVQAFGFNEGSKIKSTENTINGKVGKINDDTITFVPDTGFSGKQEVSFTITSEEGDKEKNLTLIYSSSKQDLLAQGQITAIGTLLLLVLALAIVLEFALRHIFQWRWFIIVFEGRGFKFVVSLVVALMLVWAIDINVVEGFSSIIGNNEEKSPVLGPILTALVVAGGSATVLQIWKMFNFLPDPGISGTTVKKRNFSRIKVLVDRELMNEEQKKEPLEIFIDGALVGSIAAKDAQFPPYNVLWSGHPVEAQEHTYEVVYATSTGREMRWRRRHGVPHLNVKSSVLHFKLDPNDVVSIQTGDLLTLTAPIDLKSGDPFRVGSIFAIASTNADSGSDVVGITTGIFEISKASGATFSPGDELYWDDTNKELTKATAGSVLAGVAVAGRCVRGFNCPGQA